MFIVDNTQVKNILDSYKKVQDPLYIAEEAARIKTFKRHLRNIDKLCQRGRLLDIGAYTGLFLSLARDAGWQVAGIEPSRWAVAQARKLYHLTLKMGILKRGHFTPGTFDVITLWDVIEHFTDPLQAIRICHSYLKPGGWLIMSTMDIDSLAAKILGPRWPWLIHMHRVYFSRTTMKKILEKAGFTNVFFRAHIRFVSLRYLISRFIPNRRPISHPLGNLMLPFYIGDLFEVYAQKPDIR